LKFLKQRQKLLVDISKRYDFKIFIWWSKYKAAWMIWTIVSSGNWCNIPSSSSCSTCLLINSAILNMILSIQVSLVLLLVIKIHLFSARHVKCRIITHILWFSKHAPTSNCVLLKTRWSLIMMTSCGHTCTWDSSENLETLWLIIHLIHVWLRRLLSEQA